MSKPIKKKTERGARIAIVAARFNERISGGLLQCCLDELRAKGVPTESVHVVRVPGAYELPFAANALAGRKRFDAVIALGCVIKGETSHDQNIAAWVSIGLGQASLATGVPILFGVLTPNNESQGLRRARKGPLNRGKEVAAAALDIIASRRRKLF